MERAKKSFRPRGVLKSFHPRRVLTRKGVAASAIILSVSILALFLRPWAASLRIPVAYDWGDGKCIYELRHCGI